MEINVKKYLQMVWAENKKQNLVSRRTTREDLEQHFYDSVQVLEWVALEGQAIVDIGSGAGLPGLALAIVQPDCQMTLVEANLKKSGFLQAVQEELKIDNVRIIRARAEELGRDDVYRSSYDMCTSRAVASLRVMLEYGLPLVKTGGKALLWKGARYRQEIEEAQPALQILGGEIETIYKYQLSPANERAIVAIKKVHPTPDKYPRKVGAPAKNPL